MGIDSLIASFYEAASGTFSWNKAMDDMARRLDCHVIQIIGVDLTRGRLTYSFEGGDVPAGSVLDYALHYHKEDPHVEYMASQPVGDLIGFSDLFGDAYIAKSRFYQDFLIPYGVRHMHAAKLFDDGKRAALIGAMRSHERGPIIGDDAELLHRLTFHLGRAMHLYEAYTRAKVDAAIGHAALERLAAPTWVLDDHRQVLRANSSAGSLSKRAPLVVDDQGCLRALHPASDTKLAAALATIVCPAQEADPSRLGTSNRALVSLPRNFEHGPVILQLLAIRADQTMHAFGSAAVAMVILHDPQAAVLPDIFLLTAAFEFTPAEAKVALALSSGASPKVIASNHGVSINTVQSQIRRACEKVNVNRTVDLVSAIHFLAAGLTK